MILDFRDITWAKSRRVTRPCLAASTCRNMAIKEESVMINRRLNPYWLPPAISVDQLPGSIYLLHICICNNGMLVYTSIVYYLYYNVGIPDGNQRPRTAISSQGFIPGNIPGYVDRVGDLGERRFE